MKRLSGVAEPRHQIRGWLSFNNMSEAKVNSLPSYPPAFRTSGKRYAFTLAEVLITLAIIGVVAAITIPILISKYQEKATITKVKKAYSNLSQVFKLILVNEGSPKDWNISSSDEFRDLFAKYLKFNKKCDSKTEGCLPQPTKWLDGSEVAYTLFDHYSYLILNDGSILTFYLNPITYDKTCSTNNTGRQDACRLAIHVDVNGFSGENTWAKDRFQFAIYSDRILPLVEHDQDSFEQSCLKPTAAGSGELCSAWVIYNGNMDYLHCDDLSWDGKHSCKD